MHTEFIAALKFNVTKDCNEWLIMRMYVRAQVETAGVSMRVKDPKKSTSIILKADSRATTNICISVPVHLEDRELAGSPHAAGSHAMQFVEQGDTVVPNPGVLVVVCDVDLALFEGSPTCRHLHGTVEIDVHVVVVDRRGTARLAFTECGPHFGGVVQRSPIRFGRQRVSKSGASQTSALLVVVRHPRKDHFAEKQYGAIAVLRAGHLVVVLVIGFGSPVDLGSVRTVGTPVGCAIRILLETRGFRRSVRVNAFVEPIVNRVFVEGLPVIDGFQKPTAEL
mmetsp:Transcript_11502/g.27009  ORF Transcript_11502/g.27009 Transcript_11502/m.27009 type:complete len:280 (+) Transcript_11502:13-852(+)